MLWVVVVTVDDEQLTQWDTFLLLHSVADVMTAKPLTVTKETNINDATRCAVRIARCTVPSDRPCNRLLIA